MSVDPSILPVLPAVHIGSFDRVALISDVHGNSEALREVLDDVAVADVDAVCSLGCLTWGPHPLEVLDLLHQFGRPTFFLRGNGERALLELAAGTRAPVPPVDEWMVTAHGPDGVEELRAFPVALTVQINGGSRVRLCHGSPRSDIELLSWMTAAERIEAACTGVPERTVVHGHTHLQYQRKVAGRRVAGCGSVGLPYTTARRQRCGRCSTALGCTPGRRLMT